MHIWSLVVRPPARATTKYVPRGTPPNFSDQNRTSSIKTFSWRQIKFARSKPRGAPTVHIWPLHARGPAHATAKYPEHPIHKTFSGPPPKAFLGRNLRMPQSRRHERPRSSRLQHSASFRARNPNKASMTFIFAAASICATDGLERHLAPPGFECCERDLLGRSKPRD